MHKDYLEKNNGQIVSYRGDFRTGTACMEDEADLFAAELLMPKDEVIKVAKQKNINTSKDLASAFGVSQVAMTRRIRELNSER